MANRGDLVSDDEWLYRTFWSKPPITKYLYPDGSATSRVFKLREKDKGMLSVDAKSLTTYHASIGNDQTFVLFEVLNSEVTALGLETVHDPLPNEEEPNRTNPAHCLIHGMTEDDDILPSAIAKKARLVKKS